MTDMWGKIISAECKSRGHALSLIVLRLEISSVFTLLVTRSFHLVISSAATPEVLPKCLFEWSG